MAMSDEMTTLLDKTGIWVLATADASGTPNAVPIHYTSRLQDGRLLLVDNFMNKTLDNIRANPIVSVSVWDGSLGFQFKGRASIETGGEHMEAGQAMVKNRTPKGVVLVEVTDIYSTSPGPEAGSRLA